MYKLAVLGDRESVMGFRTLGFETFPVEDRDEAATTLKRLAGESYAVIYITEQLAQTLAEEIAQYQDHPMPAIILIPGKEGSLGIGMRGVHSAVERAIGADILNHEPVEEPSQDTGEMEQL